ncbi:MAG: inosine/xanthosine triphosphatase [Xanthomonadales bacterium]|nr:inosine/xanthosine triphosphatase [Xanthomonadales bacterium]
MKVVVASHNPAKLRAVRDAVGLQFSGEPIELVPVAAESGVSDQPRSDDETRRGACNRARNARAALPDAQFWIGLEGGIETIDEQLLAFAWMAILGPGERISEARTVTLPLPPGVWELVDAGLELGEANDRVFGTVNSKHEGGAFSLLTNGKFTREGVYTEALAMAFLPFVNPLWGSLD